MQTGYIDDMPEGPWIKRNDYGVIFTDNLLMDQSVTFTTTNRNYEEEEELPDE